MSNRELLIKIRGLTIKIDTNYPDYYSYLASWFKDIIVSAKTDEPQIEIEANWAMDFWGKHPPRIKISKEMDVIGANTAVEHNRILTLRKFLRKKKIIFDIKLEGQRLTLKALSHKKVFRDKMYYKVLGKSQEAYFFEVTYPLIYYPLFWYLERFKDTHILHASALNLGDRGIVLCGMEGIGKTSLVLSLISDRDVWISDNLIFYDHKSIYPCYELIRLCDGGDSLNWKGKIQQIGNFKTAKAFCRPELLLQEEAVEPRILIFPQFSSAFFARKIPGQQAANKALILSYLPAELGNYNEYCFLYNLLDLDFNVWNARYKALDLLLQSVDCYEIGMPKADGLKKNVERIRDFLRNA
jgi:hypothetical protein